MATFRQLANRLRTQTKRIDQFGDRVKREVASAVVRDLAYNTPVDTGEHVSNWRVGIGVPPQGVIEPYAPGSGGDTRGANARAAVGAARAALKASRPGIPVYVSNAAPAIVRLNNGSSSQEPAGFVERAMIVGRLAAKKVRALS